mgnify:FL=1
MSHFAVRGLALVNETVSTVASNETLATKPPRTFGGSGGSWFFFFLWYCGGPVILGLTWRLYCKSKGGKVSKCIGM